MLLRIDTEKVVLLVVMLGLVGLVGQAHSRLTTCQDMSETNLRCLLSLN